VKSIANKLAFICLFLASTPALLAQQDNLPDDERKIAEMRKMLAQTAQTNTIKKSIFKSDTSSPLTALQTTIKGTFWRNPEWIKILALSAEQQKRMDDSFQQYRLKLIDLNASVEKEELILELLFSDTKPAPEEEARIVAQIDKIADVRSELEKANSKMLISILQVLTADQWTKLPLSQKKRPVFLKR